MEQRKYPETKKATKSVAYCGVIFLVLFTTFSASCTLLGSIYDNQGLKGMFQVSFISIYAGFTLGLFFAKTMVGRFSKAKYAMAFGTFIFAIYILNGLLTQLCMVNRAKADSKAYVVCSDRSLYTITAIIGLLAGFFGSPNIWTGSFVYINKFGNKETKGKLFGIFTGIFQFNVVSANLFNYGFYFFKGNSLFYFTVLPAIAFLCSAMFPFLYEKGNKKYFTFK